MLLHMKVHASDDIMVQDEMLNPTMRPKNEMFNPSIKSMNEYDAPMNLVLTEQAGVQQNMHSSWPNMNLHDGYTPFQ